MPKDIDFRSLDRYNYNRREGWLSGRKQHTANVLTGVSRSVGSNPTPSATIFCPAKRGKYHAGGIRRPERDGARPAAKKFQQKFIEGRIPPLRQFGNCGTFYIEKSNQRRTKVLSRMYPFIKWTNL